MNRDYVRNHNYENSIGQIISEKPHGFQIDPNLVPTLTNQLTNKKNERNIHSYNKGADLNNILQSSKVNYENQANESGRFYSAEHIFKPSKESGVKAEYAGPAMQLVC
jgi:Tfp pilus assembly ATPase PilU